MTVRTLTPAPLGFHGDTYLKRLVDALAREAAVFVETGSNVGSSLADVVRNHPHLECFSCEPDAEAFQVAQEQIEGHGRVHLFPETSQAFLARFERDYADRFRRPVLAWLDAPGYGYEWPLREEVAMLTRCFDRGSILIDDFRVPGEPSFGFDEYQGQICAWEFIDDVVDGRVAYRLLYPAYSEHTSPWHPLRGWGLLQFGPTLDDLPPIEQQLPDVARLDRVRPMEAPSTPSSVRAEVAKLARAARSTPPSSPVEAQPSSLLRPQAGPKEGPEALRRHSVSAPQDAPVWRDLGKRLALAGDPRGALEALALSLEIDPACAETIAAYGAVARELLDDGRVLPVAPGQRGRMVRRDPYVDLAQLVQVEAPTIVDGGANRGDTVARFRALFPSATIHAFEAIPELAQATRNRFSTDPRLVVHSAALSASGGTVPFRILREDVMSSTLEASQLKRRYQHEASDTVREIEVLAMPLDDAVRTPIDIVKLDLQGGELEALRGFERGLGNVRAMLIEVEFAALYESQPLFSEVEQYLRARGFRLFNLYELWTHTDGQMTSGDAIFVNERYFA